MKKIFIAIFAFLGWLSFSNSPYYGKPAHLVKPGIDVLAERHFDILKNKRIGLITNHTGINSEGEKTIDILFKNQKKYNFKLVKLFSPEHGIRGTEDTKITSGIDTKTGLPIVSLYGKKKKPTKEDLADLDMLLFDIQDIGTRYYTYQATMAYAMQACAKYNKTFVVLDRPNPIGGLRVSGAVPPEKFCGKFTCLYPIATCHGMTIGELAKMYNDYFAIHCKLIVIKMKGWERWMYYDKTGLPWINPSPNMKTLWGAIFYPGLGAAEGTTLSMGRGTAIPFEIFGAPFINKFQFAKEMKKIEKKVGIRFIPWEFIPTAKWHKFRGEKCYGIRAILMDRENCDPVLAGLYMVKTLMKLYPGKYKILAGYKTLIGDPNIEKKLKSMTPEEIINSWKPSLEKFKKIRKKYLLYK